LSEFQKFNEDIFHDATIAEDAFNKLHNAEAQHITPTELKDVIQHHLKANKRSGMSKMPL